LRRRACDPGGREAPLCAGEAPHPARHRRGDLGIDCPALFEERSVDAEEARLELAGVGDDPAAEDRARTRDGDQLGGEEPAGQGLGDREALAPRSENGEEARGAHKWRPAPTVATANAERR
jgi:hypothetical protein